MVTRPPSASLVATTPWGPAILELDGDRILRLHPPTTARARDLHGMASAGSSAAPVAVRQFARALDRYLAGDDVELADPAVVDGWLEAAGVAGFRRDVSRALLQVPRGVTISYGELALLAGRPGAARAVGTACARNPLPIVVACHRVVHAGAKPGAVGRYGAATGSEYKRRLLELERAPLAAAR